MHPPLIVGVEQIIGQLARIYDRPGSIFQNGHMAKLSIRFRPNPLFSPAPVERRFTYAAEARASLAARPAYTGRALEDIGLSAALA